MKFTGKTAAIIFLSAMIIQAIIISYNSLNGYYEVNSLANFLVRLVTGTVFSSFFGMLIYLLDIRVINFLENKLSWVNKTLLRLSSEILAAVLIGIILGVVITLTAHAFYPYQDLKFNVINNSVISVVINILLMIIIEALLYFVRNQKLAAENAEIKLETLKNQLNPHFLFNSLNVLSVLVKKDPDKAEAFIGEFASVYRYILNVLDKPVVKLEEEIAFSKAYIFLQQIRFENAVCINLNIEAEALNLFIPPLAVQTLLENAIKHNKVDPGNPLVINLYNKGNELFVVNNLVSKFRLYESKGIGLSNLKKRYELLSSLTPEFRVSKNEYTAKLPLLNNN